MHNGKIALNLISLIALLYLLIQVLTGQITATDKVSVADHIITLLLIIAQAGLILIRPPQLAKTVNAQEWFDEHFAKDKMFKYVEWIDEKHD